MRRREQVLRLLGAKPLLVEVGKLEATYGLRRPYAVQDGVAVVDVAGVLANEPSLFDAILLGATAYGEILEEVEQAIADPEVRAVLLRVNSPGGDSENAFETAAALAELARQKPIWAVADNSMFSAAYLLATAAERIYVPEFTGGAGSIGVYAEHVDWSEYNRKLGVKVTYIAEGEGKTDGNPNEPLSEAARVALASEVARLYGLFVEAIASRRPLSSEAVRQLGAALKYGPDAVAAGLADRTGTFRTALADLAAFVRPTSIAQGGRRMKEETVRAEVPEPTIDLEAIRAEAHREGYAEAREIVELCALAGLPARAAALLAKHASAAEARQYLIEARAGEDAPEIRSHVMPETATSAKVPLEQNPVIKAVKRLAKGGN